MGNVNYKQIYAIKAEREKRIEKICPNIPNNPGIYVFYRQDENGINRAYVGQAVDLKSRCGQHLTEYDHIALSLKKHKFYSTENPYGWKLTYKECKKDMLDENERITIKYYASKGYQLYNITSGGQDKGKTDMGVRKPSKGYRDGIEQGIKNKSREMAHLFDLHLVVSTKNNPPTVNQQKALDKFNDFLNYHKSENVDNSDVI